MILLYFKISLFIALVIFLIKKAYKLERFAPLDDIGVFWVIVLSLYTLLPVLSWIIQGGTYISILNPRLLELQPSVSTISDLFSMAFFLLLGFIISYLPFRKKSPNLKNFSIAKIPIHIFRLCIGIFISVKLLTLIIFSTSNIGKAESYVDQYRVILETPLIIRQLLKYLFSLQFFATLISLIFVIQNWKKYRLYFFIFLILTIVTFNPEGGRAGTAILLFSSVVCWHLLKNKITIQSWVIYGMLALIIFLVFGIIRGVTNLSDYDLTGQDNPGLGEFDAVWGNAVELYTINQSNANISLPFAVRFGEFWEFIPSQFLPFEKKSLSIWYVETFYPEYKEKGGGFAFGVLSQLAIGGGTIEGFIRGLIFGILVGTLFYWYRRNLNKWYVLPMYLSIFLYSFMSIRDTLFQQLSNIIQNIVPCFIILILYHKFHLFNTKDSST